jgi:hypothetical protein
MPLRGPAIESHPRVLVVIKVTQPVYYEMIKRRFRKTFVPEIRILIKSRPINRIVRNWGYNGGRVQ